MSNTKTIRTEQANVKNRVNVKVTFNELTLTDDLFSYHKIDKKKEPSFNTKHRPIATWSAFWTQAECSALGMVQVNQP